MFGPIALVILMTKFSAAVTPPGFSEAKEPQVAIDGDHVVYIAYGMGNRVYLSKSSDEGKTYESPVNVGELPKLALGMRRGPRVSVHNGVVTVTAVSHETGDLVAFRSVNRGNTWSRPVQINDVDHSAREGLHAMAISVDGTLACAWLDLRSQGTKLFLSISKDGGLTWAPNRLAYASPSGSVCECCHPSLSYAPDGNLYLMFRNSIGGARDMYLTRRLDGAETFEPATKLGQGTWMLNACPMDGGSMDISRNGGIRTFWRREGTLYKGGIGGREQMLTEGRQGWIVAGPDGDYLTWNLGQRVLVSTPSKRVMELSSEANDAVVAATPDRSLILAAWTENGIRATRLR